MTLNDKLKTPVSDEDPWAFVLELARDLHTPVDLSAIPEPVLSVTEYVPGENPEVKYDA